MKQQNGKPLKIGLALGGGAALGFAHIGVIKVLQDNGINIDYVAGTSMGSVIGSLFACGMTVDKMLEAVKTFDIKKITKLNGFRIIKEGLYNTERLEEYIETLANTKLVEQTKIPFRCNAVDLYTGKEYVFKSGSLGQAVRASSAIPGLFKPVRKDNMLLVDGGVVNNIPFNIAKQMGADFVIAVDVCPKYVKKEKISNIVEVITNSFGLIQNKHELARRAELKQVGFVLEISSSRNEQDYSLEAMNSAYELGVEITQKNILKLKRAITKRKKELGKV